MSETTTLAPVQHDQTVLPVFSGTQMTQALTAYKQLQAALDAGMPDAIMLLDGKPFRKKSYWRAVATAFQLTVLCMTERREEDGHGGYRYMVTYQAQAQNGRVAYGDGACASEEKAKGRMRATEHNVRSHAHTRAFNRAVSNLVGFGEVSAEEVEHGTEAGTSSVVLPAPQAAEAGGRAPTDIVDQVPLRYIEAVDRQAGSKDGKPWERYDITFVGAIEPGKHRASTFKTDLGQAAMVACNENRPVIVGLTKTAKGYYNVTSLTIVEGGGDEPVDGD